METVTIMPEGSAAPRARWFGEEEYLDRRRRVRAEMQERNLGSLVVVDPANMHYLSGYDGWSFYVPQALVLGVEEDSLPYWIGRPQDTNGARITTELDDEHIRCYPESYVQSRDRHPMDALADLVRELGSGSGRVGVEMDAYYFSAAAWERLRAGLPRADLTDSSLLVNWCRFVKSDTELELMRLAARLTDRAMATAVDAVTPGARECDAAARIVAAQYEGIDGVPGDYPAIVPLIPSRERTSTAHLTWVDRRYEPGDVVNLELSGCIRRYHAPLARTLVLGDPPPALERLAEVVAEGVEAALGAVRPGATCADVEAAWRAVLARNGYRKDSRLGYSVGVGYPPDWGEHTASFRRDDDTVLVPGAAFHMIAGMWMDDHGFELSETVVVGARGVEVLTRYPRRLLVNGRG